MLELKKEYDELLAREKKAAEYLDNQNIPIAEREKWIPQYKSIINRLGAIMGEMKGE